MSTILEKIEEIKKLSEELEAMVEESKTLGGL